MCAECYEKVQDECLPNRAGLNQGHFPEEVNKLRPKGWGQKERAIQVESKAGTDAMVKNLDTILSAKGRQWEVLPWGRGSAQLQDVTGWEGDTSW